MTFTTNFDLPDVRRAPTPAEMGVYDAARAPPLTVAERRQVTACALFLGAYTARCEHFVRWLVGMGPRGTVGRP
ncbi:MAG TPA: hypothetical protein VGF91_07645 [Solirubrobacteraceae bacterium]|jgi:hypothetical protein